MIELGLAGKRAVVFGAGFVPDRAGHGRAVSLLLGEAGALVACADIDEGRARATAAEVVEGGGKAFPVIVDVTDSAALAKAFDEIEQQLGGIDVVIDIVGRCRWSQGEQESDALWDWSLMNNLTQVYYVLREASKRLVQQGTGGSIVALASVDGIQSSKYHVSYGAAKAGVISLIKSFADEMGPSGIRVNCVAPGNVGGGNWDLPPAPVGSDHLNSLAPPRGTDIGKAVLFLVSDLAGRVTGQTLVVDGGLMNRSPWGFSPSELAGINNNASQPSSLTPFPEN